MQTPRLLIRDCLLASEDAPADDRALDISSPCRERLEDRRLKTLLAPICSGEKAG
jgi:hypothetical protein